MKKYMVIFLLTMPAIGVAYSGSARVQNKTKRTVSRIQFHPKWITPPVEYSSLIVRDKIVRFNSTFVPTLGRKKEEEVLNADAAFEEEDDFWEHLSFNVTNTSDKTISYIQTNVFFYTAEGLSNGVRDVGANIIFGNPLSTTVATLKPGESTRLSFHPEMVDHIRQELQKLSARIVRIGIYASSVHFDDGYHWDFDGKLYLPKPREEQSSLKARQIIQEVTGSVKFCG